MKRIILLAILVLITGIMFSCNDSSGGKTEAGYINPGLNEPKTQALKSYTFPGFSCTTSESCGAIIYTGKLNNIQYVGFAAGNDSTNAGFSIKVYWTASSIPESADIPSVSYKIIINDGTNIYNTTTDNLNITITAGTDTQTPAVAIYTILFNEPITVSDSSSNTFTIANGNSIVAYKYPE